MKLIGNSLLVIAALVLAACGNAQPQTKEITIEATDIAYSVTTIEVEAGQPVRLTLKDSGTLQHDFSILEIPVVIDHEADEVAGHEMDMSNMGVEPQVHVAADPGTSNTVEFTPTKPGTYEFFCTVAGHKEAGMIGQLIVK